MFKRKKWNCKNILTVLVLILFINLPVVSALEISNVNAKDITANQATVTWNTDEPEDSFVNYGVDKGGLQKIGDAKKTTDHEFQLDTLLSDTEYYYSVESGNLVEDNSGDYYSFKTLVPDTSAPTVIVDLPELVAGMKTDITGWTEIGAEVKLFIDGSLAGSTVAIKDDIGIVISSNEEEVLASSEVEEPAAEEPVLENETTTEIEETEESEVSEEVIEENSTTFIEEEQTLEESEAIAGQATSIDDSEKPAGTFTFVNVVVNADGPTEILIEATDASGNKGTFSGQVYSDNNKPKINLSYIPEIIDGSSLNIEGTFSEKVNYEIFIKNQSTAQGEGTTIKETISLEEGDNQIIIVAKDIAGWETIETINVYADTQAPTVTFSFEKGSEYYQGRAVSSINGETEPGSTVYLYVYRQIGSDYAPDFKRARKKVSADQNGSFTFSNVDFEDEPISLDDLAPSLVPEGLQEYSISGVDLASAQQSWTYYIFVVAEDKIGKVASSQSTITLKTCYSADWDFDVQSLVQFQRPMRLDPGLLDDGRAEATAVFNLSYRGSGYAKTDRISGNVEADPFVINSVDFDKACTQSMMEDDQFRLGCTIMQNQPSKTPNADNSAWYLIYKLNSAEELSDKEDDFWNEFKKRQIIFPMKIRINYQERGADGQLGPTKTQSSCYDLGYFVDIPIDSADMLPDWLADEGMEAIDFTIKQIDTVLPYLEKAILVTGIGCISSFLGRMVARWTRIFTSKLEVYFTRLSDPEDKCPKNQNDYYLKSTIEHWTKLGDGFFDDTKHEKPKGDKWNEKVLDDKCPLTASAWKLEAGLDQAYRWTCDRVFCRSVPAGWTASKDQAEVDTVILAQQQCTVSSRGIPLIEIEDCGKLIKENVGITRPSAVAESYMKTGEFTCYKNEDKLYVVTSEQKPSSLGTIVRLRLAHGFGYTIGEGVGQIGATDLLAYRPPNAEQFIIGQDQSCANACRNPKKSGYKADLINSVPSYKNEDASLKEQNGCYKEVYKEGALSGQTTLKDTNEKLIGSNQFSAGYTNDCFVDYNKGGVAEAATESGKSTKQSSNSGKSTIRSSTFEKRGYSCKSDDECSSEGLACRSNICVYKNPEDFGDISLIKSKDPSATGLLQCVCTVDEDQDETYGARTAAKEKDGKAEDWVYRQAEVFKDSNSRFGTYYPKWRYYNGRDLSSAFGADYLIDYTRTNKTVARVSPNSQFLGAYQTVCLSVIRAHLTTLRSILEGLKNCIDQAKNTGLTDAGVCKTIFAQHVCGLMYKAIAYFFTDCSPYSMTDEKKEGVVAGIGEVFSSGFGSIGEAMDSSISDIKDDYGNAKLNEFFATGAQGFTESICMFAFGYDWPLGMDFILDSAHAVEMKTTAMVFPAERELATFNPSTGTAVYNYNIGALVLPGCEIRSADVYLKCVGPEDQGRSDVQCGAQGCDCLYARESSSVESEKKHYVDTLGVRNTDLKQGSLFDFKIPSPQKVDSSYRYDHVVIDLKKDTYANADNCFDVGHKDGKFYFPIIDISPPSELVCQVQPTTGRYSCPEIQKMFGAGSGGYLEDPYISCYNKDTGAFDDCDTPNLFVKGDVIKAKVHFVTDGEPYCLKVTTNGLGARDLSEPKSLAKNLPGPYGIEINLGSVTEDLFSGASNSLTLTSDSDSGCSRNIQYKGNRPTGQVTERTYAFTYTKSGTGYVINMPSGVTAVGNYNSIGTLTQIGSGKTQFSGTELQGMQFYLGEFLVSNLVGSPSGTSGICKYQVGRAAGQTYANNPISVNVKAELLMSENGNCFNANIPVKAPAFGKQQADKNILVQLNPLAEQITNKMHQEFMQGNCQYVQSNAKEIIERRNNDGSIGKADLAEAIAVYYSTACYVVEGGNNWQTVNKDKVCNLLNFFFNRQYSYDRTAQAYPLEVTKTSEYNKVYKYLNETADKIDCGAQFSGGTTPPVTPSGTTMCGKSTAKFKVTGKPSTWIPDNWKSYVCKEASPSVIRADPNDPKTFDLNPVCWEDGVYATTNTGCPGVELCCPPGAS
jgi:hypothetical protein